MTIRIAINGYGRIGRCIVRALLEQQSADIELVAINDLMSPEQISHLTQYDTTHGHINNAISVDGNQLCIDDLTIELVNERDVTKLPWKRLGIDLVLECTGLFTERASAAQHLEAGAKKVLLSAPGKEVDATIVYGVNHDILKPEHKIISNASCTTNCLAPLVKPLNEQLGVISGLVNTIHAYTNDQSLLDTAHNDLRRARAAGQSIIPTTTGAAKAVGLVLPDMIGKLDGFALRVPTPNVSLVDLTFKAAKLASVDEVNNILLQAVKNDSHGVIKANNLPLVSSDFNHNPASAVFDLSQTMVIGDLIKVLAWYDNEWGFANRMLDVAALLG